MHGDVLIFAGPSVAHLATPTAGAICPGKVSGLTDELTTGFPSAPQLGAGLHVGAGFGAQPEGQLTLMG